MLDMEWIPSAGGKESPPLIFICTMDFSPAFPNHHGFLHGRHVDLGLEAKKLLASVFNVRRLKIWQTRRTAKRFPAVPAAKESLYLVLSGFTMSSIFSKCQLDCRPPLRMPVRCGAHDVLTWNRIADRTVWDIYRYLICFETGEHDPCP